MRLKEKWLRKYPDLYLANDCVAALHKESTKPAALPPSLRKALGFPGVNHLNWRVRLSLTRIRGKSIGKPEAYRKESGKAAGTETFCAKLVWQELSEGL